MGNTGLTNNTEVTLTNAVALPYVINTHGYTAQLIGKLRINTAQTLPGAGADGSWSEGVLQTANSTSSIGKVIIQNVSCPFRLTVNHTASSADAARKLVVTLGGIEVYNQSSGNTSVGLTALIDSTTASSPCTTGATTIEAYGHNGTNGAGVRIYDVKIEQ